jgi:hypothetical protein
VWITESHPNAVYIVSHVRREMPFSTHDVFTVSERSEQFRSNAKSSTTVIHLNHKDMLAETIADTLS